MMKPLSPKNREVSKDGILQFTVPGATDLTDQQDKANRYLRLRVSEGMSEIFGVTDMWERLIYSMREAGGIGLSANQIGLHVRAFIVETPKRLMKVMEPTILEVSDINVVMNEGCLSVGEAQVDFGSSSVARASAIVVEYHNGEERVREGLVGMEARAFQHEYDHLNGFIFTDHRYIGTNIRKQMMLQAGCFEPTYVQYANRYDRNYWLDGGSEKEYHDPTSDVFRTTQGTFRQRLLRLIDGDLITSIEAW